MPQKVVRFTGINRRVNEFSNTGACEELINLRPLTGGGYQVIKNKSEIMNGGSFDNVYEHLFGEYSHKIFIEQNGNIDWENHDDRLETITEEFNSDDVVLSFAGNVMVAYSKSENKQLVFKFENGTYKPYDVAFPKITDIQVIDNYIASAPVNNAVMADDGSAAALNSALQKAASGFYSIFPNGLCGAAVIGCAYELEDGSEVWATGFIVANATRYNGYSKPFIESGTNKVVVNGASKVSLHLTFDGTSAKNIKKINIYATRPVLPYTVEQTSTSGGDGIVTTKNGIFETSLDDENLGGQLMYYQGSIMPNETKVSFPLKFNSEQAGENIMEVNSGCIERTGEVISYNNRFHYYNSEVNHIIQRPTISDYEAVRVSSDRWIAYVEFNDGEWKLIKGGYRFNATTMDFIYPMSGVKRIAFVKGEVPDLSDFYVPYTEMFYVNMKDSTAYNYSYAFDVTPDIVPADHFGRDMSEIGQYWSEDFVYDTTIFLRKESNAINVSVQYNPFAFPVKYSYSVGGKILELATSYLPISSTQIGQFPITVFTTEGIYALEQGDGSVLYSNIVPLQPLIIDGKATSTPYGTFFISSNSLYLLLGREIVDMSQDLKGKTELSIRDNDAYNKLFCNSGSPLCDYSELLSSKDFERFLSGASMTYDQLRNELYIRSDDNKLKYSYVLNLETKLFHKFSGRYWSTRSGARYVLLSYAGSRYLVDLNLEEDVYEQPIFLQSRPMPLETFNTHIQRLILLADATLTGSQNLCVSVFASDNLNDWKCIISAQKHKTVLRQIRTNRAAKSYRDYVIIISGVVSSDTDLSDIIVDYTVVNRRLG